MGSKLGEDMIIAGIDLETGGAANCKPKDNFITEIGIALYDTDLGKTPVKIFNTLVKNTHRIDPEMSQYTGITDEACDRFGVEPGRVAHAALGVLTMADMFVAHNGIRFDYPVLDGWFSKIIPDHNFSEDKILCDTMIDVPWGNNIKQKNLTYLAGAHEMYNPFPHRAITDAMTMMKLFFMYPLNQIVASAQSEFVRIKALVSIQEKDLAKNRKFWFDGETKSWYKEMRTCQLVCESQDYEFKYQIVPLES